ncbi:MAG: lamin tail domain-containing protein, partial [Bacteroidota bacterium]
MEAKTKTKIFNATFIIVAFFVFALQTNAASTDIIFTEIMYSLEGTDSNREWIEIYNNGTDAVSIVDGAGDNSWWFNDGSNHGISLAQGNLIIPAGGFAILADDAETFLIDYPDFAGTIIKTIMSLKNTEDTILLSADNRQTFFGEITYQNTWGANGDGNSLQLSGNNWIAATPTPGQATSAKPQEEPEQESSPSTSTPTTSESSSTSDSTSTVSTGDPTKVKITEIFPNPEG